MNVKDAESIFKSLDENDDVNEQYVCEAKCVMSKCICMKKADDRGMYCYMHDPDRKCLGITMSGARCGSVAKVGETHCHRHRDVEEQHYVPKSKDKKIRAQLHPGSLQKRIISIYLKSPGRLLLAFMVLHPVIPKR